MDNAFINSLLNEYRDKIEYIGIKSDAYTRVKQITAGRNPDDERLFSVEGIWAYQKLLNANIAIDSFVLCPDYVYSNEAAIFAASFINKAGKTYIVSRKVYEKLSERDDPDGFIIIGEFPSIGIGKLELKEDAVIAVLDGLETPGNIGTILRTCDGSGVDAVFICNKRVRLTNSKLIKGSMGAVFAIPIVVFDDISECIKWLEAHNFRIYLADAGGGKTYKTCEYEGNTALVLGNERYGLSADWYEIGSKNLHIPMFGACDSLNVGTAASIILYEICLYKKSG